MKPYGMLDKPHAYVSDEARKGYGRGWLGRRYHKPTSVRRDWKKRARAAGKREARENSED